MDETEVVIASQDGDKEAFGQLIDGYYQSIYRLAYQYTGNHPDADDLCQETFVRALDKIRTLKSPESFKPWIFTIAVNLSRKRVKRTKYKTQSFTTVESQGHPDTRITHGPVDHLTTLEKVDWVQEQIQSLPDPMRLAVVLVHLEGLTQKEAATIVKCSEASLSRYLESARQRLYSRLHPLL